MGSDRARVSYNHRQQYRSVVMQQGRVTLEADWNEAQQITQEEIQREALDFVGPAGTPDNGYEILVSADPTTPAFDFAIGAGTMYVGGMRTHFTGSADYGNQSDWRDYGPEDPDWVDLSSLAATPPTDEFVFLYLREQEVSAVEDLDLKDVALGGPDTAQRTRLLQRIVRVACDGTGCTSGLAAANTKWQSEGLHFDSTTMRLDSWSTLGVGFSGQVQTQNPCQPQAQGGYVGADNQLIRVQISGIDPNTQDPLVLWGFDDASFLYQIQVDAGNPQQLDFQTIPVDAEHQPVSGQAVEVLRTAAELSNGANVAATTGFAFTLTRNYDPDSQSIQLPSGVSLPADYLNSTVSPPPPPQLFLRVWQSEITCTPGLAYPLANTGVTITLQSNNNQPFHVGDYWLFAVRTATPQIVYPERYQNGFQPPDGPRLWACPLGVITWSGGVATLASDCRNQFCNLVAACKKTQDCCCSATVGPEDLAGNTTLQSLLDMYRNQNAVTICLQPGSYNLASPLRLTAAHSNISLKACGPGVAIQAQQGSESAFMDGLMVLDGLSAFTIQGITFNAPLTPFVAANGNFAGVSIGTYQGDAQSVLNNMIVSIGLRTLNCAGLTIRDCEFAFGDFPEDLPENTVFGFGAGIFASGSCTDWIVTGTTFAGVGPFIAGFLLAPTVTLNAPARRRPIRHDSAPVNSAGAIPLPQQNHEIPIGSQVVGPVPVVTNLAAYGGSSLPSSLNSVVFGDNTFSGMTVAALVLAALGPAQFSRNQVQNCTAGFWLMLPFDAWLLGWDPQNVASLGLSIAMGYPLPQTTQVINPVTVGAAPSAIRVFAGAKVYTDSLNEEWTPDVNVTNPAVSTSSLNQPKAPSTIKSARPGSNDQALYQSERYAADFSYTFSGLTTGYYTLTLKFAEFVWTAAGERVFDVIVNGTQALTNYDIFATVGGDTANDWTFNDLMPDASGQIKVEFKSSIDNGKIDAIALTPQWTGTDPNLTNSPLSTSQSELLAFYVQLEQVAEQGFVNALGGNPQLRVTDNEMQGLSAPGFLFLSADQVQTPLMSSLMMTGNRLSGAIAAGSSTALFLTTIATVLFCTRCVVNSNMITNEESRDNDARRASLAVYDGVLPSPASTTPPPEIMIASNVLQGIAYFSPEPYSTAPSPMNTWDFFNSIVD